MFMIAINSRKRELRLRQAILKGVYEDNLRIIGRAPNIIARKIPFSMIRLLILLSVLSLVVLGQGNYLNFPSSAEKQTTSDVSEQKSFLMPVQETVGPVDYSAFLNVSKASLSRTFGLEVKTIMIDPGHGGSASGTIGKMGTREKDITLDIAKRLRERLKKYGNYNVLLTREQDITVPLNKRVELARSGKADLFLSIHINYLPSEPLDIIETYYFGPSSDDKTLKLAEHENAGSQYGLSDFREVIEKIGDTIKFQESRELAASIQRNLFLNIRREDRNVHNSGVKRAPFLVLLGVDVPAVLAEVSCLSNKEEEVQLNTARYRENIAHYLENGILDYLTRGEVSYEARRR